MIYGLRFGFRGVEGSGFRVLVILGRLDVLFWGLRMIFGSLLFREWGEGFMIWGLGFGAQGLGFRV